MICRSHRQFSVKTDLARLQTLINSLKNTTLTNHKIKILKANHQFSELLQLIYHPHSHFNFSSASLNNLANANLANISQSHSNLISLLKYLQTLPVKLAKQNIAAVIDELPEHKELIKAVIDGNLKCRIGPQILEKAFPSANHQPSFNCTLAFDWKDDMSKKFIQDNSPWLYSRKLDGVRCVTGFSPGGISISMFSRSNRPFLTPLSILYPKLRLIYSHIAEKFPANEYIYLDGELCVMDEFDKENFIKTSALVRTINPESVNQNDAHNLFYYIFDCLTESELKNSNFATSFTERLARVPTDFSPVLPLAHFPIKEGESVIDFIKNLLNERCQKFGHEGLMLRLNLPGFHSGRTRTLLKVKQFDDQEFPIIGLERNIIRYLENGQEQQGNLVSALIVKLPNGKSCSVGSGMSLHERKTFSDALIGCLATIKFQGFLDGQLRFPVFKGLRNEDHI